VAGDRRSALPELNVIRAPFRAGPIGPYPGRRRGLVTKKRGAAVTAVKPVARPVRGRQFVPKPGGCSFGSSSGRGSRPSDEAENGAGAGALNSTYSKMTAH